MKILQSQIINNSKMKKIVITVLICLLSIITSFSNPKENVINSIKVSTKDTIKINARDLISKEIALGKSNYIMYGKKDKSSNASNLTFVEMNVEKYTYQNIAAYKITQKWFEKDTVVHTSESILSQKDLKSLYYKSWWKRNSQIIEINFLNKSSKLTGSDENFNKKAQESMHIALTQNTFLNWHCDLVLFGLLPFKEGVTFQINLLNPGFSAPTKEYYKVLGSEKIEGIDCWILNFELPSNMGYQRFWISKSEKIVIKEEDSFRGAYRFKLKTKVAE